MRILHAEKFDTKDARKQLELECRGILEKASFDASKASEDDRREIILNAVSAVLDRMACVREEAAGAIGRCIEEGELHVVNCDVQRLSWIAGSMLMDVSSSNEGDKAPYLAGDIRRFARSIYSAIGFDWRDWRLM